MLRLKFIIAVIFSGLIFGASATLHAQTSSSAGAIQGVVQDPNGSVLVDIKVTLVNVDLGLEREARTLSDGTYIFPLLKPTDDYEVEVEAPGFEKQVLSALTVRVSETTIANAALSVGAVSQQVVVSGAAQQIDTTSSTLGQVVDSQVITALPLPTRNVFDIMATDAGVYTNLESPAVTILQGGNAVYVAGQRANANNYLWNGIDANSVEFHSLSAGAIPIPDPDAIQEFRTETSLYDATSAYGSGGNINLVTRAGTSSYHGVAYDFLRNTVLNANDYFLNQTDQPIPVMQQNQFGGSFGGKIPHGHNTYFFVNYEGMRQKNGVTGAISGELPVLPTNRAAASLAAAFDLPVSAIDPVAVKILNSPGPYGGELFPSLVGTPGSLGTFAFSSPVILNANQVSARLDHDFKLGSQVNHIAASSFVENQLFSNPGGVSGSLGQGYAYPLDNQDVAINDTQVIRPNFLNEIVFGYNWYRRDIEPIGTPITLADIGMTRSNSSFNDLLPTFGFSDSLSCCGYSANVGRVQHTANFDFRDTFSWIHNKHTLRFGFETIREEFNEVGVQQSPQGSLSFQAVYADEFYGKPSAASGIADSSFRDFLIGAPIGDTEISGYPRFYLRSADYSAFLQDDFRITHRLTLNLGLRYDHFGDPTEKNNHFSNFDPSLLSPTTIEYGGTGLEQGFVIPGVNGTDSTLSISNLGSWAPRFGLAWDVLGNGKLAIRGGYGLYYQAADDMQSPLVQNPPYFEAISQSNITYGSAAATQVLDNPFPALPPPGAFPVFPTFQTVTGLTGTGAPIYSGGGQPSISFFGIQRNGKYPYAENWNVTADGQVAKNWTLEVGYLGTNGVRQSAGLSLNNALLINASDPGRFGLVTNSSANRNARVPVAGVSATGLTIIENEAFSSYNALLVTLTHRITKNFLLKAAYTYSKSIDNFQANPSTGYGGSGQLGNQFALFENKATSEQNVPNRLVVTYVWYVPGPKEGALGFFFSRWSLAGITTYQNGLPFSITQSIGTSSLTGTAGFGLITPDCQIVASGSVKDHLNNYLNAGCVSTQPLLAGGEVIPGGPYTPYFTPGDQNYTITPGGSGRVIGSAEAARNAFRAPFQQRWDMTLSKNFPIKALGEGGNLEFRTEAFKVFNNAIFSAPNSVIGTAGFGEITSTIDTTGRQLQFALKLSF